MTTQLPKLGTQERLFRVKTPTNPSGTPRPESVPGDKKTDWSGWYPFGPDAPQTDRPTVTLDGECGGVDIGGNPDRPGRLVLRDQNGRITQLADGQSGATDQLGDLVLSTFETESPGASFNTAHPRIRLSGKDGTVTLKTCLLYTSRCV